MVRKGKRIWDLERDLAVFEEDQTSKTGDTRKKVMHTKLDAFLPLCLLYLLSPPSLSLSIFPPSLSLPPYLSHCIIGLSIQTICRCQHYHTVSAVLCSASTTDDMDIIQDTLPITCNVITY